MTKPGLLRGDGGAGSAVPWTGRAGEGFAVGGLCLKLSPGGKCSAWRDNARDTPSHEGYIDREQRAFGIQAQLHNLHPHATMNGNEEE